MPALDVSSLSSSDGDDSCQVHRVRTDLYEERSTPWSGIGAFATNLIPSGTRIFCEDALILLPEDAHLVHLRQTLKALPEGKEALFWALAGSSSPSKDTSQIEHIRTAYKDNMPDDFNALVEEHEQAWSIFETNRFTVRLEQGKMLGVFPMSARLNHSCVPNVFHRFNPSINRLTIHALRDIQEGEELFTSYIDVCHPTATRRQLLKNWGFLCRCNACDSADRAADVRRRKLAAYFSNVSQWKKERAAVNDKGGASPRTNGRHPRSMDNIERGIKLMEGDRMEESDTLGIFYALAARTASESGRHEEAVGWANKAVAIERKCLGEDSREYRIASELLDAVQSAKLLNTV